MGPARNKATMQRVLGRVWPGLAASRPHPLALVTYEDLAPHTTASCPNCWGRRYRESAPAPREVTPAGVLRPSAGG